MASIIFSIEQLNVLRSLTANGTENFYAGYDYLASQLSALTTTEIADMGVTANQVEDCLFWLGRASAINQNDLSDAANNFIRDVTRYGLLWDQKPVGTLQANSDAIGGSVVGHILLQGSFPEIDVIVGSDVQAAISEGGQTIAGWGGAFYYWHAPYPAGGPGVTVGSAISADPGQLEKFISLVSCATYQALARTNGGVFNPETAFTQTEDYLEMLGTGWAASVPVHIKAEIVGRCVDFATGMRHYFSNDPSKWEWQQTLDLSNAIGAPQAGQHGFTIDLASGMVVGIENPSETFQTFLDVRELRGSNLGDVVMLDGAAPFVDVMGGAGDDYVFANGSEVVASGGGGFDVFVVDANQTAVNVVRSGSTLTFNDAEGTAFSYVVRDFDQIEFFDATVSFQDLLGQIEQIINGTAGDDTLHGTPGMDVINGLGGHDTIYGYEANDRLYGGSGNDTFHGGTGSDAMFGEADNDTFHLGEAEEGDVDYVNGGAHTGTGDVVEVSVGATYRLDAAGAAAIRNQIVANGFAAPTGHGIGIEMAVGDAFVQGVEIIRASAEANELVIGTAADLAAAGAKTFDFTAGADDSVLYNGEMAATLTLTADNGRSKAIQTGAASVSFLGLDEWNLMSPGSNVTIDKSHLAVQAITINAGPGIDILNLTSFTTGIVFGQEAMIGGTNITVTGFERVYAGSGNDTFHGTDADEVFMGNGGTNTFYGSLGEDYLSSSGGNLIVDYSLSAEAVIFMRSSSTSTSAVAHASMSAGSMGYGDTLVASGWSDITGSEEDDTLLVVGTHGTLRSNGGTDTLVGNKNGDTLIGADGYSEIMRPGDGNDTIQFGTGGGTLDFSTSTRAAVIDLLDGTFVFGDQVDTVTGEFDKVIGTAYADDILGTEGADTIDGGSGSGYDVIYGRGGDDTITFRTGVVHGGTGNDVISSTQSSTIVFGEDDEDTISVGKNSLAYGGDGSDTITAGEGSTIYGDDGADTINVSAKFVTVHGGAGGDVINISAISWYAMSTLSYSQSDAGVSVVRSGSGFLASGGHAEGDQLSGKFNVAGSDFADVFDLDVSDIGFIKAGGGDDVITLRLTDGEAYGESGDDTITLTSRHQDAFGGDGNDTFHGYGRMFGDDGDDEFYLGYGNYAAGPFSHVKVGGTVRGGSGQNYIEGGAGNDTIWMDEGSDTFIYSAGGGHDQIYVAGSDDHLVLDGIAGFSSIADIAANLFEDASRTELRFDGFDQKIGFMNMTASQVLGLDWAFA